MADNAQLKNIVEAALLAAGKPLDLDHIRALFEEGEQPEKKLLREVLKELSVDYEGRGIEILEVASGRRIQVRSEYSRWVTRLWEEKPGRYSRALMETLALIAYRQPITRGEIEDIRGVSVSSNITKTLLERDWVRVVGQRDVPGKPSLYGTTRTFLDYFNLKTLDDLPTLAEIRDLDEINRTLDLEDPDKPKDESAGESSESGELPADAEGLAEAAESAINDAPETAEAPAQVEGGQDLAADAEDETPHDPMATIRDDLTTDAFDDELPALDAEAMGEVPGEADSDIEPDSELRNE